MSALPWLLVFDLDGTLIDSSLDLCLAVNAAMDAVGDPQLPHEMITSYIGDGAAMLVRRALGDPGDLDSAVENRSMQNGRFEAALQAFLEFYREHKLDNTHVYEGVLPSLTTLRAQQPHLLMAVLTNKPVNPSKKICDALALSPFFFANYGGNSFATKKPDPYGLLRLADEARALHLARDLSVSNLAAEGVVMVGDSETDVLTARRAGARSLGCRYGLAPHTLESSHPDLICDSPYEWPALLGLVH